MGEHYMTEAADRVSFTGGTVTPSSRKGKKAKNRTTQPKDVLILERYRSVARLVQEMLKDHGFSSEICSTADEAIGRLATARFRSLILDPHSLEGHPAGLDALAAAFRGIPMVAFTSSSSMKRLPFMPALVIPKTSDLAPLMKGVGALLRAAERGPH
jgi:CheY-like chemotaxis protein